MKKILIGLLTLTVLALFAAPASAGVNLRQKGDGTACWESGRSGECVPTGEHSFTVAIPDIAAASTQYVVIPFKGRLRSASVVVNGQVVTATETITFLIASPASTGCTADTLRLGCGNDFDQFTPVTPLISEAATGLYELVLGIAYGATGQRAHVDYLSRVATSLDIEENGVIAINNDGASTAASSGAADDDAYVTIYVY